jgi:hypothetical protein
MRIHKMAFEPLVSNNLLIQANLFEFPAVGVL